MKKPNSSAPAAATIGAAGSASEQRHPRPLDEERGGVGAEREVGGVAEETMPPKPISRLKAVAKSPTIAISVSSCRKNGGSTSGASARATVSRPSAPRRGHGSTPPAGRAGPMAAR